MRRNLEMAETEMAETEMGNYEMADNEEEDGDYEAMETPKKAYSEPLTVLNQR